MNKDADFVHLHVHSEYSLSSSLLKLEDACARAHQLGMPALALTDWNNLYGSLHLWKEAKEYEGLKPIFGAELGLLIEGAGNQLRHIVLLAKDRAGFQRLSNLVSLAHTQYGWVDGVLAPRLPLEKLLEDPKGLVALTGSLKGVLNSFILQDQEAQGLRVLEQLKSAFKDDLFLELQDTGLSPQRVCNEKLLDWGKAHGIPVVATNDVHYLTPDDAVAQEIWMMTAQKLTLAENPRSHLASTDFAFRSAEEMREVFSHIPEACDNTLRVAERCNVKLSFKDANGKRIFHLPVLKGKGKTPEEVFAELCWEGLERRFEKHKVAPEKRQEYKDRLKYEIDVINKMGFASYYQIVSDFIRWAKTHEIPVGPGRGSGAGSLAAYVLDITNLDPLEHGLLFERFLNPERVSLPDFDIDFCQARRHEVIRYVAEHYGQERVCQIVTFMKEQSKAALKDVGRVLGLSFGESNRLTKLVPVVQMKPASIKESLEQVEELRMLAQTDPKMQQVIDLAGRVEGALRQAGVHAAGVIIASQPLIDLAPMSLDTEGKPITQWDMKMSEEAGLVKFDFLGLVTLDLLDLACKWVNRRANTFEDDRKAEAPTLNYENVPIYDPRIYQLISAGDTLGVFQLESSGMQNLCVRLKPENFSDITAINALFRPGPLESGMVDDFINRKQGRAKVEYTFPEMEACLKETYGTIVYQEQVMEIAKVVGGYTLGGADILRRAMGKKNVDEMQKQRAIFVEGAAKSGKDPVKAGELFELIEKFAGYGFNKSHAAAYMVLAAQTAYLKAVYPTEFFAALLTIDKENTDKLSRYIMDARQRGIEVLPPDVNQSEMDFAVVADKRIRFGLSAIKNVGEAAVAAIIAARDKGPFKDLFDFCERVDGSKLNKRVVECLIQAGAFDTVENNGNAEGVRIADLRGRYLATVESALDYAAKELERKNSAQVSLFGDMGSGTGPGVPRPPYQRGNVPASREMLDWEKQLLGIYVSGSPLDKYLERARKAGCKEIFSLGEMAGAVAANAPKEGGWSRDRKRTIVSVGALVAELREVRVKKGKRAGEAMAILKLEDHTGQVEMVSFPDHYKQYGPLLKAGQPLLIRAELEFEEERPKLVGSQVAVEGKLSVEDLAQVEEKWPRELLLDVLLDAIETAMPVPLFYKEVARVLERHHGKVPVKMNLLKRGSFATEMALGEKYRVMPSEQLLAELQGLSTVPGALRARTLM